jgi:CheY-like chemotaxis protein
MQGTDLAELVTIQVRLDATDEDRVSVTGPFLFLGAQDAGHLGMVLHELTTNARKYGALSTGGGRVSVSWELQTNAKRCLVLQWRESGGPKVRAPEARGFGMTLIEQTVRVRGGEASMHFAEDGLRCRIEWPVAEEPQAGISPATLRLGESSLLGAPATPSLRGKTVLIVEDEPLVAMDMQSTLDAAGCTVIGPVGTVREALKLVADSDCDAALVDVNLKGEPVDKLLRALQRKGVDYGFVTGYGAKVLSKTFQETVTLTKPFSGEQLLAVVEVLLYLRGAADVVPLKSKRGKS